MTIYHLKQSIAGCLRNNRVGTIDFLEDGNGKPLSDAEARIELNKLLAMGHTVMPVGDKCEGFDVFGGGCPGHEPLAGSNLDCAVLEMANKPDLADFFMAEGCTFSLHRQSDNRLLITLGDDSGSARDRLFLKEALRLRDTLNLMYPKEEFE